MKKNEDVVLDELKICYKADQKQLAFLKAIGEGEFTDVEGYRLYRLTNGRFRFFYEVTKDGEPIAELKFGLYSEKEEEESIYVFLKVLNHVLYNNPLLRTILQLPDSLGFRFNNFTAIDLALDSDRNLTSLVRLLMRDKTATTILNGRAIEARSQILKGVTFEYSTTLNKLMKPTITFRQKKAIANKNEGITVQVYEKKTEIEQGSGKQYILDYYGGPKQLYRMEVRLPYQEIKDYFASREIAPSIDLLFDSASLTEMFLYHLSAVIRFSRGRRKIPWEGLLGCTDRG